MAQTTPFTTGADVSCTECMSRQAVVAGATPVRTRSADDHAVGRRPERLVDLPCGRRVERVGLVGGVRRHGGLAEPRPADGCVQRRGRG